MRRGKEIAAALGLVSALKGAPAHAEDPTVAMAGRAAMHEAKHAAHIEAGPAGASGNKGTKEVLRILGNEKQPDEVIEETITRFAAGGKVTAPQKWEAQHWYRQSKGTKDGFNVVDVSVYDAKRVAVYHGEDRYTVGPAFHQAEPVFSLERLPQITVVFEGLITAPSITLQEIVKTYAVNNDIKNPVVKINYTADRTAGTAVEVSILDSTTKKGQTMLFPFDVDKKQPLDFLNGFLIDNLGALVH